MPFLSTSSRVVEIIIAAKDQASATFEKVGKAADNVTKGAKETSLAFGALAAAGTALIAKTTLTAARTEELGVVIDNLGRVSGYTEEEIDAHEKAIKELGITTQSARTIMSRFMGAQLDLADASKIARAAQDLAVIGMQDSSEAAANLTYAIASMQPRVLRQYGLFINLNEVYKETAATLGKQVENLTEAEKRQGMLNAVLEQAGNFAGTYEAAMGTAGKQLRSFNRYVEEVCNQFGEYFLPYLGEAVSLATDFAKAFLGASDATKQQAAQLTLYVTAAAAAMSATAGLMAAGKALIPVMSFLWGPAGLAVLAIGATTALTVAMYDQYRQFKEYKRELLDTAKSAEEYAEKTIEARDATFGVTKGWRGGATAAREYAEAEYKAALESEFLYEKAEQLDNALRKEQDEYIAAADAAYYFSEQVQRAASEAEKSMTLALGASILDLRENIAAYDELEAKVTTVYADTAAMTQDYNKAIGRIEEDRARQRLDLEERLQEKIHYILKGAHARSFEENEKILAWQRDLNAKELADFDAMTQQKIDRRTEDYNDAVGKAQAAAAERSRLAEEARQAEMQALKEAQQERLLLFAFEMLEHKKLLTIPVEGYGEMQVSAQEYFDLAKAGIIEVSSAITQEMGKDLAALGVNWEDMGDTGEQNMDLLSLRVQTVSGDVMDLGETTDTETSEMGRHIERVEKALLRSEGKSDDLTAAIEDTGVSTEDLRRVTVSAHNTMQREIKQSRNRMDEYKDSIREAIRLYNKLPQFEGGGVTTPIPEAQAGMAYVPRTGPTQVHVSEAILNAQQAERWRRAGGGITLNLMGDVYGMDGASELFEDMLKQASRYAV